MSIHSYIYIINEQEILKFYLSYSCK